MNNPEAVEPQLPVFLRRMVEGSVPLNDKVLAYVQLLRPANIITAWADILAGFAASGLITGLAGLADGDALQGLGWLLAATTGLYGGGVVFNDVFDARLDAVERPERPIPSGRAERRGAGIFGSLLLCAGVLAAAQVSGTSAGIAVVIALFALLYDAVSKHHSFWGPLNMGLCRGGNLLLGVSVLPAALSGLWFLAVIPLFYIGAITAVSQGEVHGGESRTGWLGLGLLTFVLLALLVLGILPAYNPLMAAPFVVILGLRVLPAFWSAARIPEADNIRNAVRAGILSLIVLNAGIAAGFAGWEYGLLVLLLWPVSNVLARAFAVT